ncbi:MAG: hypothetical protein K940chlam3_00392 [Chlamydiae bacterium]|nr:hypothetical protein [Chlamydiota bacterium]
MQVNHNYFENLPDEVLLHIFQYLTPIELDRVSKVSQRCFDVANTDSLWQPYVSRCLKLELHSWFTDSWKGTALEIAKESYQRKKEIDDRNKIKALLPLPPYHYPSIEL